ncbi:MAG: hypothetical protein ACXV79_02565 [Methylobacter sp.]
MSNELILRVRPTSNCTKNTPPGNKLGKKSGHPYVPRVNLGGNFCGHYPDSPTLNILVEFPDKFPSVLIKFSERVEAYYARPKSVLESLNATNNSKKQQSSARREACVLLLKSIARNTELSTMRCGVPSPEGFGPLTLNVLAIRAGLSLSRAKRAMQCLKRAGLIAVTRITQVDDLGRYKGVPAIKRLNDIVFSLFGLGEMLKRARKAAYKRLKVGMGKDNAKKSVTKILGIKLLLPGSGNRGGRPKEVTYPQNRTELFRQLSIDNPHLSTEEVFNIIKNRPYGL